MANFEHSDTMIHTLIGLPDSSIVARRPAPPELLPPVYLDYRHWRSLFQDLCVLRPSGRGRNSVCTYIVQKVGNVSGVEPGFITA